MRGFSSMYKHLCEFPTRLHGSSPFLPFLPSALRIFEKLRFFFRFSSSVSMRGLSHGRMRDEVELF